MTGSAVQNMDEMYDGPGPASGGDTGSSKEKKWPGQEQNSWNVEWFLYAAVAANEMDFVYK